MSALKTGALGNARFTKAIELKTKIQTERSGGGV
jgi:hypothetical protein